jgi:hypothetical protein
MPKLAPSIDCSAESLARHVDSLEIQEGGTVRASSFRAGKRPKLSPLPAEELRSLAYARGVPKEGSGEPGAWEPDHAQRVILLPWTDESIDSYNTIFDSGGWDFRAYDQNPVVFFNHDGWSVPIGITLRIDSAKLRGIDGVMRKGHVAHVLISPEELEPKAEIVLRNWVGGRLRGASHSFNPTEASYADGKDVKKYRIPDDAKLSSLLVFRKQELRELSVVGMPANTSTTSRSEHVRAVAGSGLITRDDALQLFAEDELDGLDFPDERGILDLEAEEVVLQAAVERPEWQQRIEALEATVAKLTAEGGGNQHQDERGGPKARTALYAEVLSLGAKARRI